jgi:dihydrofolate reductase
MSYENCQGTFYARGSDAQLLEKGKQIVSSNGRLCNSFSHLLVLKHCLLANPLWSILRELENRRRRKMRKLLLEVQTTVDGYMADPNGNTDWAVWNWGEEWSWDTELRKYHNDLTASIDCILLSRKVAQDGFVHHWATVAQKQNNPQSGFAKQITAAQKVVFTKTLNQSVWERTVLAKGNLTEEVLELKKTVGRNIIAYGGAAFVSSLIASDLVDEFHLIVNPVAIGSGLALFSKLRHPLNLSPVSSTSYTGGIVVLRYVNK